MGQLFVLMNQYASNRPPFNQDQQLTPSAYWVAVVGSSVVAGSRAAAGRPELLADIATRLLQTKPTAASIEQVGTTGWWDGLNAGLNVWGGGGVLHPGIAGVRMPPAELYCAAWWQLCVPPAPHAAV